MFASCKVLVFWNLISRMLRGHNIIALVAVACLTVACFGNKEYNDTVPDERPVFMVQCVLTDTTSIQRAKLYYGTPGGDTFSPIPPKDVLHFELKSQEGALISVFEYAGDGIWEAIEDPKDEFKYNLSIVLKSGEYVSLGTTYPKRPKFVGDVRAYEKAYFPSTDDVVDNVIWFPKYPESGRADSYVDVVPSPSKIWFFVGQPRGDGKLRYSDFVATSPVNRASSFNKVSTPIWSMTCWTGEDYESLGWKVDRGRNLNTYSQGIYVMSYQDVPGVDIFSYDLIGDYDVDYAKKHLPGQAEDNEAWAAYDEPLLIAETKIVEGFYDTWLQNSVKDGRDGIQDFFKLNLNRSYNLWSKDIGSEYSDAYGLFGAESVIRYPLGLSKKDLASPVKIK